MTAARGVALVDFSLSHPDPMVSGRLREYALPQPVEQETPGLRATLLTPAGMVELRSGG